MEDLTIAVLRGGPSYEYQISLKTGESIIRALNDTYRILDIFIDKSGQWHRNGLPVNPMKAMTGVDVAVIALHGDYGEDGQVQRVLDKLGIPYTGSNSYASSLAIHKPRTRFHIKALPMIKHPEQYMIREDDGENYEEIAEDIFSRFGPPYIVKPATGGSSIGLFKADSIMELPQAIAEVKKYTKDNLVLVEQAILGKEISCGVIEGFRGEDFYTLPVAEIVMPENKTLYDYEVKYTSDEASRAEVVCPARITKEESEKIQEASKAIHIAMDLDHYSRSDFILAPHGLYFLEVNTLPGLTEHSIMPKTLEAVGSGLQEMMEHIVELALNKK